MSICVTCYSVLICYSYRTMPPAKIKVKTAARPKTKRSPEKNKADFAEYRHLDRAAIIPLYYGFTPLLAPLAISKEDREIARELAETDMRENASENALVPFLEQKLALLRLCFEKNMADGSLPILLYSEEVSPPASARKDGRRVKRVFLDVIGSGKSIAEAILIKTAWTLLLEEGRKNLSLSLNSMGDKDSLSKFTRELAGYYRKNIHLLPPQCRAALRRDPLLALSCIHEKCAPLKADAPKAMEFLSEASRIHFKEVLEYMEALAIPYRLDHCLVGSKSGMGETVFEVTDEENQKGGGCGERVCFGFRYGAVAKRIGFRKDMPAVGTTVFLTRSAKKEKKRRGFRIKKPQIFFLQLGFDAKLHCLTVIETLRLAGIPLHQALARDKLATQLATAENLKIPFSLIMGQKEAMEESVIVRNNSTRAQETVKISGLAQYLKKPKVV